ncbi:hypothetical protein ASD12_31335 [Mesorhizobium sp. Root102]|nr:hypothetical protein ASD12_31335 [Mesorhizobium sp. Root102]
MIRRSAPPGFCEAFLKSRPNLFSNVPVFLAASVLGEMGGIVDAIECATKLSAYRGVPSMGNVV